jgi:hypothetical protein
MLAETPVSTKLVQLGHSQYSWHIATSRMCQLAGIGINRSNPTLKG